MADELDPVELQFIADMTALLGELDVLITETRGFASAARDASAAVSDMRGSAAAAAVVDDVLRDSLLGIADATDAADESLREIRGDLAGIATTAVRAEWAIGILTTEVRGLRAEFADAAATGERMARTLIEIRDNALQAAAAATAATAAAGASGLAGVLAGLGPGGVAGGAAIAIGSILALVTGLFGIIPAAVAAGLGLASFAVLAVPFIGQVTKGLSATQQQLDQMPTPIVVIVNGIKSLQREFSQLATAMGPTVEAVAGTLISIAGHLLPFLLPLAQAAGKAINTLLAGFDGFVTSPGFKAFMTQMDHLAGPMIITIGEGIGKIVIAVGKLLIALSNPEALRSFKYLLDAIAFTITFLAGVFTVGTVVIVASLHWIAVEFDDLRHNIADRAHQIAHYFDDLRHAQAAWWHELAHIFDDVRHIVASWADNLVHNFDTANHAVAAWAHDLASYFDEARANIARWANDVATWLGHVVAWFQALPGRVLGALAGLAGQMFTLGENIMIGLYNGIVSWGAHVVAAAQNVGSGILHAIGSFLGIGSPARATFEQGMYIGMGWANGIAAAAPLVAAAVAHISGLVNAQSGSLGPLALAGARGGYGGSAAPASGGVNVTVPITVAGQMTPAAMQQLQQVMQTAVLDFFTRNGTAGFIPYGRPQ